MNLNDDGGTDGNKSHHNTGNRGSMCTVRAGSRSLPRYPLVIMCLGLLNTILMLAAIVIGIYCGNVSEGSHPHQITAEALIVEVKQLQIMQTEAIKAQEEAQQALEKQLRSHQQLKLQLEQNKTASDGVQRQLEILQVEKATLQSSTSDIRGNCRQCQSGWLLFNTSCYFHSISASNPRKNWTDSRADCIRRGGDLAVIDSMEEQLNLFEYLPKLDKSIRPWWRKPGTWIGLINFHGKGSWVWINNVTLHDQGYWIPGQPSNNNGVGGQQCGAIMNIENPTATWYDATCPAEKEYLCEMEPN